MASNWVNEFLAQPQAPSSRGDEVYGIKRADAGEDNQMRDSVQFPPQSFLATTLTLNSDYAETCLRTSGIFLNNALTYVVNPQGVFGQDIGLVLLR